MTYQKKSRTVLIAFPNIKSEVKGYCILVMVLQNQIYADIKFTVLDNLCAGVF